MQVKTNEFFKATKMIMMEYYNEDLSYQIGNYGNLITNGEVTVAKNENKIWIINKKYSYRFTYKKTENQKPEITASRMNLKTRQEQPIKVTTFMNKLKNTLMELNGWL